MRWKQLPDIDAMIEVSHSEFHNLRDMGGLLLDIETKNRSSTYFWLVQGTWILILVKGTQDGISEK